MSAYLEVVAKLVKLLRPESEGKAMAKSKYESEFLCQTCGAPTKPWSNPMLRVCSNPECKEVSQTIDCLSDDLREALVQELRAGIEMNPDDPIRFSLERKLKRDWWEKARPEIQKEFEREWRAQVEASIPTQQKRKVISTYLQDLELEAQTKVEALTRQAAELEVTRTKYVTKLSMLGALGVVGLILGVVFSLSALLIPIFLIPIVAALIQVYFEGLRKREDARAKDRKSVV